VSDLIGCAPNTADLFRRAATFVDKVLKGAKPGNLPIEQPTTYELAINLKTTKVLGLELPRFRGRGTAFALRDDEVPLCNAPGDRGEHGTERLCLGPVAAGSWGGRATGCGAPEPGLLGIGERQSLHRIQ
jgi:hypothetical protein